MECPAAASPLSLVSHVLAANFAREEAKAIERLPFTIKRVQNDEDMWKAVRVRHAAYARHIPIFAQTLTAPELSDYEDGAVVLLAESKLDGSALGSTRIRNNFYQPLSVEASIVLPEWLQHRRLAEVTRLSVNEGRTGEMVKAALLKACVAYCQDNAIEWALATGRAPIDRQYERLMFVDLFADKQPVPLKHVGNIPHRVMAFEIDTMEARWAAAKHPMLDFFCRTTHPDIDISNRFDLERAATARDLLNPTFQTVDDLEMA
ncbi:MAG: hypothetical protein JWR40_4413 [Massilia sp.]|jgi:hypothetical protein|nr:hypothetical protein [Massilia sp.]MDB5953156.1 hypothetical protein [Massilia sp.]